MIQKTLAHEFSFFMFMLEFLKIALRANSSLAIPYSVAFVLNPTIFPSILVTVTILVTWIYDIKTF